MATGPVSVATSTATTATLAAAAVFRIVPAAELSNGEKMRPFGAERDRVLHPGDLFRRVEFGVERLQQIDALSLRFAHDVLVVGGPERRRQRGEIDRDFWPVGGGGADGERARARRLSARTEQRCAWFACVVSSRIFLTLSSLGGGPETVKPSTMGQNARCFVADDADETQGRAPPSARQRTLSRRRGEGRGARRWRAARSA